MAVQAGQLALAQVEVWVMERVCSPQVSLDSSNNRLRGNRAKWVQASSGSQALWVGHPWDSRGHKGGSQSPQDQAPKAKPRWASQVSVSQVSVSQVSLDYQQVKCPRCPRCLQPVVKLPPVDQHPAFQGRSAIQWVVVSRGIWVLVNR